MRQYRDGFVDPKFNIILTEDKVIRPRFPKFLYVTERIGDTALSACYAALSRMARLRYPLYAANFTPEPKAWEARAAGAACLGACALLIAAKSPEAAQLAANTAQDWIHDNVTEPLVRMNSDSSWLLR